MTEILDREDTMQDTQQGSEDNSSDQRTHGIDISSLQRDGGAPKKIEDESVALEVKDLRLSYGPKEALHGVNMIIPQKRVTAFIGPSGCGKSTLLRCFNRMNDLVDGCEINGQILLEGNDIYHRNVEVAELRRRVGMVFQKPNPFPKSIYENVAYGLRIQGINKKRTLDETMN